MSCGRVHLGIFQKNDNVYIGTDGEVCVAYDGEIHVGLAKAFEGVSKTILNRYRDCGLKGIEDLSGSYSILISDAKQRRTILSVDRVGTKQIYYRVYRGNLYFAPNIKTIIAATDIPQINSRSLFDFMAFGFILNDRTLFDDIKLVRYGSSVVYHWDSGVVEDGAYWDF